MITYFALRSIDDDDDDDDDDDVVDVNTDTHQRK